MHKHRSPSFLASFSLAKRKSLAKLTLESVPSTVKRDPPFQALFPFHIQEGKKKIKGKNRTSVLAEPLEGAQPRLLTVQMVPGPDVPHSFIYLYEQLWGGFWVPDISSFVQGSFVFFVWCSVKDNFLLLSWAGDPTWMPLPCPSHQAHFPPQSHLSSVHPRGLYSAFNSYCLTSGILPHQPTGPQP